ncbi:hypothetical protein HDIA_0281 [Hartmannibacter diazotrophicus]|uniref:Secreted protein n=1 Tax=Hartmannibacter diazotrophicus TaxID=1482074 RepID=A0A2C9D0H1_9HYPH|nr:hypothetical protein [Hartmannibacter diazotrophicus]SON53822.1 hypothetical protein HDIA_0281 [Hartmannibacter diazotrophicus]
MRQTATNSLILLPPAIGGLFLILLLACVPAAVAQTAPSTGMERGDNVGTDQFADGTKVPTGIAQDDAARTG